MVELVIGDLLGWCYGFLAHRENGLDMDTPLMITTFVFSFST